MINRHPDFETSPGRFSRGSHVTPLSSGKSDEGSFLVEQTDIESFLASLGGRVALVKMDIEGAEVDVLERLLNSPMLSFIENMFVETHEFRDPETADRTRELRRRFDSLDAPYCSLDWV